MIVRVSVCVLCVFVCFSWAQTKQYRSRYEFKYSFKGPNLVQPDNTVPFWNHTGDAVPGDEQVRIVPSLRGKKGGVWSKYEFPYDEWEAELHFRVHGRGKVGADGLVLWLVETPNQPGTVFGYMDNWKGMGIFFDSFDNDNKKNNPYIYVIVNDGTISYSHATDGLDQKNGGCMRDFRNRPYPVKVKINFSNNILLVSMDQGNTDVEDYEVCFRVENMFIPKNYYWGITAATGGLADDHDVLKLLVSSLHEKKEEEAAAADPASDEKVKFQQEYEKNLKEFEKEQEQFKEQHPDMARKDPEYHADELFEGGGSSELRSIFEIQSLIKKQMGQMVEMIQNMEMKQSDIFDKIEETRLNQDKTTDNNAGVQDIRSILDSQQMSLDLIEAMRGDVTYLRSTIVAVSQSISRIGAGAGAGGATGGAGGNQGGYDQMKQLRVMQEQLDSMQNTMIRVQNKQNNPPKLQCPEPEMPSCVSLGFLAVIALVQVIAIIAYHTFKASREDAAKKFF